MAARSAGESTLVPPICGAMVPRGIAVGAGVATETPGDEVAP
jgi:hypothetical protein